MYRTHELVYGDGIEGVGVGPHGNVRLLSWSHAKRGLVAVARVLLRYPALIFVQWKRVSPIKSTPKTRAVVREVQPV